MFCKIPPPHSPYSLFCLLQDDGFTLVSFLKYLFNKILPEKKGLEFIFLNILYVLI